MPVKKSAATAFVNVRGLALACFNGDEGRSEVAIIREPAHRLSLIVSRPGLLEGAIADTVGFVSLLELTATDLDGATIEIAGVGETKTSGLALFQSDNFERLAGAANDPNDIRWIVDLESDELHAAPLVKNDAALAARPDVTPLFIANAEFYAVMPDLEDEKAIAGLPYFFRKDASGNETEFGYIAETMGANIVADAVSLKITRDGNVTEHIYKHTDASPVRIEIANVNPDPNADVSDLPMYYRFLRSANGETFELNPRDDRSTAGGAVNGRVYCHIARVGKRSIKEMV